MIPKIIHYCWFGGNLMPEDAKEYIRGWKKLCPDYQIIEWNENNFDINSNTYVKEAYENRKWAFVTDYVRLFALYKYGGIYLDTDVEIIRPLECFLSEEAFSGFENEHAVPTGIMASIPEHPAIRDLLEDYNERHFVAQNGKLDMTTNVEIITNYFLKKGLILNDTKQTVNGFTFFPHDFFCPLNSRTLELCTTPNTYAIHHFAGSWIGQHTLFRNKVKSLLGPQICKIIIKIMDCFNIK